MFSHQKHDRFGSRCLFFLTLIPIILIIGISIALISKTMPILQRFSLSALLGGTVWKPSKELFGYLPFISATFWVTILSLLISIPPCLLTAIYLSEYANQTTRMFMRPILDLLAAIPSVIYGVWGLLVIVPWVQGSFLPFVEHLPIQIPLLTSSNPTGFGILSGSIVLAVMIAPFIISITHEVLSTVPAGIRQASYAVGATRFQTIGRVILPATMSGIIASIVLAFSRAMGETMAVLMVVGNVVQMPSSILDAAYPLPALIANNYGEMMSIPLYDSALMGAALILLLMVLILNILSTLTLQGMMGKKRRCW